MASSDSAELRSISTSTDWRPSRIAASTTSTATTRAAIGSAESWPADTKISPISTANEPSRSEAKCSALAASAADWWRREPRRLATARLASTAITSTITVIDHHVTRISCASPSASR